MFLRIVLLASFAIAPFGTALAEEEMEEQGAEEAAAEKVCFNRTRVRGFDGLTDEHVFIEQSGKEYFLLTMRTRCSGLRHAHGIGIKDTMSRICSDGFGEIIFRDMGRPQRCRIGAIERVENKDEAKALIAEREEQRKYKKEEDKDD